MMIKLMPKYNLEEFLNYEKQHGIINFYSYLDQEAYNLIFYHLHHLI